MRRRGVAIVGAGFSGAAVAAQLLLRRGRNAVDVVLIERDKALGRGLAYGVKDKSYLLNVRAANMSAIPNTPDDFVKYLKTRERGDPANRFAPRALYGAYVDDVLGRARDRAGFGRFQRIRGDVLSCSRDGAGWSLGLAHGKAVRADIVVLALGNAPASPPAILSGVNVLGAWDAGALKRIPRAADVLLVGAGLTMVDVALSLAEKRTGTIYALSRRGLTPRAQVGPSPLPQRAADLPLALSDALHAFRKETREMVARAEPWQWAIERIRAATPELWRRLTIEQQRRFLRHLRPWWDVHRHRAAPEIGERIAKLMSGGQLRILAGEIIAAETTSRGVQIMHRGRGSLVRHRLEIGAVVNCTGSVFDVTGAGNGLVAQLRNDGLVRGHATGLGFDVDADGRLIDVSGNAHPNLFTLGPPTQGAYWESTAVPEIRKRAELLAQILTATS